MKKVGKKKLGEAIRSELALCDFDTMTEMKRSKKRYLIQRGVKPLHSMAKLPFFAPDLPYIIQMQSSIRSTQTNKTWK